MFLTVGLKVNLITTHFAKTLQLSLISTRLAICGSNHTVSNITKKCLITIFSQDDFTTSSICYVVPVISSNTPAQTVTVDGYKIPNDIQFSDSEFYLPNKLNADIGSSLLWDLIIDGKIQ